MDIKQIFKNNQNWVTSCLENDAKYFDRLSKEQSPKILYFGCSDSRVVPELIMGVEPGDVFVHRNIANIVSVKDRSGMSVLAYAVTQLQVEEIIICGHYGCGGVKAAMHSKDLGILNPWIDHIRVVMEKKKETLDRCTTVESKYDKLIDLNVIEQCQNIYELPIIKELVDSGDLKVHGWVFDIKTGNLIDLKVQFS